MDINEHIIKTIDASAFKIVYQKGDNSNFKKKKCKQKAKFRKYENMQKHKQNHISVKSRLKCDINFINFTLDLKHTKTA